MRSVAADWGGAVALARSLAPDGSVSLPKAAEPALPADLDLRPSNFPWSIHKGAVAVYREAERGEHLQVREYPDRWVVTTDSHNPRYRPAAHAAVDVPVQMLLASGALTPVGGYRWVVGDRLPSPASAVSFSAAALGAVPRLGRRLLP